MKRTITAAAAATAIAIASFAVSACGPRTVMTQGEVTESTSVDETRSGPPTPYETEVNARLKGRFLMARSGDIGVLVDKREGCLYFATDRRPINRADGKQDCTFAQK